MTRRTRMPLVASQLYAPFLLLCLCERSHAFSPESNFKSGPSRPPPALKLAKDTPLDTPLDTTLDSPREQYSCIPRADFLTTTFIAGTASWLPVSAACAFRGGTGAGGLGKTRPETGVVFFNEASVPTQQRNGDVVAELVLDSGRTPVLVSYNSPWPLLETTSGMETRNLQEPESAFVQVVHAGEHQSRNSNTKLSKDFFVNSIFASQGKYGAYGAPLDIYISPVIPDELYKVSFTSLTPAMRESERRAYVATRRMGDSVVMLVTGSTAPRFNKKEEQLRRVAESFQVVVSPKTSMAKDKHATSYDSPRTRQQF